jgi:hypothetical protein
MHILQEISVTVPNLQDPEEWPHYEHNDFKLAANMAELANVSSIFYFIWYNHKSYVRIKVLLNNTVRHKNFINPEIAVCMP